MIDVKEMELIEDGIIPVYENENKEKLVNGRELHEALGSKRKFSDWIKQRLEYCGSIEGQDFITFHKFVKREGSNLGSKTTEYALTLDTAKEFAMIEHNEIGKKIRKYFIEVEKKYKISQTEMAWRELTKPETQIIIGQKWLEDREARKRLEAQNQVLLDTIKQQEPKVLFADSIRASNDTISVNELAKLLKQNGYNTGQNRLFAQLREEGYLIKRYGDTWNLPTQKSMDLGLFNIQETEINTPTGIKINKIPKVTTKGVEYFIQKYCKAVS